MAARRAGIAPLRAELPRRINTPSMAQRIVVVIALGRGVRESAAACFAECRVRVTVSRYFDMTSASAFAV
jgi:hypothetical protein